MRKIRLDLDALDVDTFPVTAIAPARGTLVAHDATEVLCPTNFTACYGACGGSGPTFDCPLHTERCTGGELCYSVPGGWCDPTDFESCDDTNCC